MTKSDQIQDEIVKHQAYIIKVGEGQAKQANETIDESIADLEAAIAIALISLTDAPTKANQARLVALENRVRRIRAKAFEVAELDNQEDMNRLADSESRWMAKAILTILAVKIATLPESQVSRIVSLIPFAGKTPGQWWGSALASDVARIMTTIRAGIQNAIGAKSIIDAVVGTKTTAGTIETTRNEVKAVARTIATGVSNEAQDATVKKTSVIDRVMWVSILDSRTSTICRGLSGTIWGIMEPHPSPPAHPNSVKAGTMITTDRGLVPVEHVEVGDKVLTHMGRYRKVYAVMAKQCDTPMVDLVNEFGEGISLTNDHPILTDGGWINAGDIKPGCVAFQNFTQFAYSKNRLSRSEVEEAVLINAHNSITTTREELIACGIFSFTAGMSSAIKLNYNVMPIKKEVSNPSCYRNLKTIPDIDCIKKVDKHLLMSGGHSPEAIGVGYCDFISNFRHVDRIIGLHTLRRCITALLMPFRVLFAPMIVASWRGAMDLVNSQGISSFSALKSKPLKCPTKTTICKFFSTLKKAKALSRFPMLFVKGFRFIFGDRVSHDVIPTVRCFVTAPRMSLVDQYNYEGMVFNLSVEEDETYIADSYLVHNCRSSLTYIVEGEPKPEDLTYNQWIKRQPREVQEDILPKWQLKELDKGVPLSTFVTKDIEPMTMKQYEAKFGIFD